MTADLALLAKKFGDLKKDTQPIEFYTQNIQQQLDNFYNLFASYAKDLLSKNKEKKSSDDSSESKSFKTTWTKKIEEHVSKMTKHITFLTTLGANQDQRDQEREYREQGISESVREQEIEEDHFQYDVRTYFEKILDFLAFDQRIQRDQLKKAGQGGGGNNSLLDTLAQLWLLKKGGKFLKSLGPMLKNILKITGLTALGNSIKNLFVGAKDKIFTFIKDMWGRFLAEPLKKLWQKTGGALVNVIQRAGSRLFAAVSGLGSAISGFFGNLMSGLTSRISNALRAIGLIKPQPVKPPIPPKPPVPPKPTVPPSTTAPKGSPTIKPSAPPPPPPPPPPTGGAAAPRAPISSTLPGANPSRFKDVMKAIKSGSKSNFIITALLSGAFAAWEYSEQKEYLESLEQMGIITKEEKESRLGNVAGTKTGEAIGGTAGALAGAAAGAKIGTALGTAVGIWFGGVGAIPAAVIGGIAGTLIGGFTGALAGESVGGYVGENVTSGPTEAEFNKTVEERLLKMSPQQPEGSVAQPTGASSQQATINLDTSKITTQDVNDSNKKVTINVVLNAPKQFQDVKDASMQSATKGQTIVVNNVGGSTNNNVNNQQVNNNNTLGTTAQEPVLLSSTKSDMSMVQPI